jgi:hypothetical protein
MVSLIVGLFLLLCFGEIGLIITFLFYLASLVFAAKVLWNEYRRSRYGPGKDLNSNEMLVFSMDAFAGTAVLLDVLARVAATKYGHIYVAVGGIFVVIACVLWANGLTLGIVDYFRAANKFLPAIAVAITLFSILLLIAMLLQPASFWKLQS